MLLRFLSLTGLLVILATVVVWAKQTDTRDPAHATVMVKNPMGHGSGVNLGHGYILTAAHVVADKTDYTIVTEDGQTAPADVLWVNKDYDVALLHADIDIGSASLACRAPVLGERVEAVGNPMSVKFVHTYGQVGGLPRKFEDLRSTFIASLTVVPGMSGGPVFDSEGHILGLVSAVINVPTGMMQSSLMPISFIIPSSVVCDLLGRST